MKLWIVSRPGNEVGYDEYDSFVVAAESAGDALRSHPRGLVWRMMTDKEANSSYEDEPREAWLPEQPSDWIWPDNTWDNSNAFAEEIGTALSNTPAGTVVCASFNAG